MIDQSSSAPSTSKLKCPQCEYSEITRSRRANVLERGLSLVQVFPYRCQRHTCQHRFYAFGRNRQV